METNCRARADEAAIRGGQVLASSRFLCEKHELNGRRDQTERHAFGGKLLPPVRKTSESARSLQPVDSHLSELAGSLRWTLSTTGFPRRAQGSDAGPGDRFLPRDRSKPRSGR